MVLPLTILDCIVVIGFDTFFVPSRIFISFALLNYSIAINTTIMEPLPFLVAYYLICIDSCLGLGLGLLHVSTLD